MANYIYSRVTIEPQLAMEKIIGIIHSIPEVPYGQETKAIVKAFYTEEDIKRNLSGTIYSDGSSDNPISNEGVNLTWLYDNIGTPWITIDVEDDIRIDSPSYIPDGFLIKLYSLCIKEFDDVTIYCRWWDETETQCGIALIKDGIYTEHEGELSSEMISDPSYYPSGFEDINLVKDWVISKISEDSFLREDIENWKEDDIRDTFSEWKEEEKWNTINSKWSDMKDLCNDAIETENSNFPILKFKKIAQKKYEMLENYYPFI